MGEQVGKAKALSPDASERTADMARSVDPHVCTCLLSVRLLCLTTLFGRTGPLAAAFGFGQTRSGLFVWLRNGAHVGATHAR
jgi:hypothetical protein